MTRSERPSERDMQAVRGLAGATGAEPGPDCLSHEVIAALVDGTLVAEARERVLAHVADCTRCAAEVAALSRALHAPAVRNELRRLDGWLVRRRGWTMAVGGVLAAGIAFFLLVRPSTRGGAGAPAPGAAELVARATAGGAVSLPAGWADLPWTVTRGGGVAAAAPGTAFRIGVRLLDLEIALGSGDGPGGRR